MGLLDRVFGKKPAPSAAEPAGAENEARPGDPQLIDGPPELVRAVEIQRAYWTHHADEQAQLQARGVDRLTWRERLRLHQLLCLQRLKTGAEPARSRDDGLELACRLVAADSPYRPRHAIVWQGSSAPEGTPTNPDLQGTFLNPSLTHLASLEVYRVDAANQPTTIDFVSFDELCDVVFGPPSLIRAAKLFFEDGREEVVLVPVLYGLTWAVGNEHDRAGRMTRFVGHVHSEELSACGASGLGVGQQDFVVIGQEGSAQLFGHASVAQVTFPLDMRDPRFAEKARARGVDPDEVRSRVS